MERRAVSSFVIVASFALATLGGRVLAQNVPRVPRVRTGEAEVGPAYPREAVRRVVRRHLGEVERCYQTGIATDGRLEGRVSVRFVIGPTGAVVRSEVVSSTLATPETGACIAEAINHWMFPAPHAGSLIVTYPFVLSQSPTR
jgi:hypothetical protein